MKILIILHKSKKIGGMVLQFLKMANQFQEQGHEVKIFSFDNYSKNKNLFYYIIKIQRELKKQIKIFNPSIIFTSDPYITASIGIISKPKTTPIVIRIGTILHLFYASRITEEISPDDIYNSFFRFIAFVLKRLAHIVFKKIDHIVFNSFFLQTTFKKITLNSTVIHNGVDMLSDKVSKSKNEIKLVYIGRIHPRKTIELIINSLQIIKNEKIDFHFSIIGDVSHHTQYWNKLSNLITKYKLWENITVHGQIENKKLPNILASHDILLFSTDKRNYPITEGLPNVILEGMANGLAIISTNAGGVAEILHSKNGFIVEPNANSFAEKIKFLALNREELQKMKRDNIKTIKQNHSIEKTSKLYLKLFDYVLMKKKR